MKKLIFILGLFICFQSWGQIQNNNYYRPIAGAESDLPSKSDLSAYYAFEETSGTVVYDSHTNSLDGTNHGAGLNATGKNNLAYDFEASQSDYVKIGDSDYLSFTNGTTDLAFSFNCWIKPESFQSGGGDYNTILSKRGTVYEYQIGFRKSSPNLLHIHVLLLNSDVSGVLYYEGVNTFTTGTWQMFTFIYDGSEDYDGIKTFRNGVEIVRFDDQSGESGTYNGMSNTTANANIGKLSDAHNRSDFCFDGLIDELGIWKDLELTQTNITALYDSGNGKFYNDLTAFLKPLYEQLLPLKYEQLEIPTFKIKS